MTSRKRNKGKERKAKKAEIEAVNLRRTVRNTWKCWARGDVQHVGEGGRRMRGNIIQCNHGCNLIIPDDNHHPVCGFMDAFFMIYMGVSDKTMTSKCSQQFFI